jgi:hypothetical protein
MTNKKLTIIIISSSVVLAGVLVFFAPKHQPAPATTTEQKKFDPYKPDFISGTVVAVNSDQMQFTSSGQDWVAKISTSTKLTKQIYKPKPRVSDALLADFRQGSEIMVLFSNPPQNNVYQADKIQLITP